MKKKITPQNYLDKIPMRKATYPWRVREDGVVEIDRENKSFYDRLAQKFFGKPRVSHIALDQYGGMVWQNLNAENTIYDIVNMMEKAFPKERETMLKRVVTYMATLEANGFIEMKGAKS